MVPAKTHHRLFRLVGVERTIGSIKFAIVKTDSRLSAGFEWSGAGAATDGSRCEPKSAAGGLHHGSATQRAVSVHHAMSPELNGAKAIASCKCEGRRTPLILLARATKEIVVELCAGGKQLQPGESLPGSWADW